MRQSKLNLIILLLCVWVHPSLMAMEPKCGKPLVLGWEEKIPYHYRYKLPKKKSVRIIGLDIEIISNIVLQMNCAIMYRELPFDQQLEQLKTGELDIMAGGIKNPVRKRYAHFSRSYRTNSQQMFVATGTASDYNFKGIYDLVKTDFILGIIESRDYGKTFKKIRKKPNYDKHFLAVKSMEQNFENLLGNKIQGFLGDPFLVNVQLKEKELKDSIELHGLRIKDEKVFVMLSKKSISESKFKTFDGKLHYMKVTGKLKPIFEKYLE